LQHAPLGVAIGLLTVQSKNILEARAQFGFDRFVQLYEADT